MIDLNGQTPLTIKTKPGVQYELEVHNSMSSGVVDLRYTLNPGAGQDSFPLAQDNGTAITGTNGNRTLVRFTAKENLVISAPVSAPDEVLFDLKECSGSIPHYNHSIAI